MPHVFWPRHDDFVPSSLSRVLFNDIVVDLDTSQHYIQVCSINTVHVKL